MIALASLLCFAGRWKPITAIKCLDTKVGKDMRDFIFVIGASGVGKSTLSQKLFEHYQGAYAEMSMGSGNKWGKIIAKLGYTSMLDYYLIVCEN